jgi:hypothetical protein
MKIINIFCGGAFAYWKSSFQCVLSMGFLILQHFVHGQFNIPNDYEGNWHGMMYLSHSGAVHDSVNVQFLIQRMNNFEWQWKTDYKSDKMKLSKDYTLKYKGHNHYVLDEHNGIHLQFYLYGDKLFSIFEMGDQCFIGTYIFESNKIHFEIISGKYLSMENESIRHFHVVNVQRVTFKRLI